MLQINELRVGNYLKNQNISEPVRVGTINSDETIKLDFGICKGVFNDTMGLSSFEPIPITEDWLIRFGFEISENLGDIIYYELPNEKRGYGICFDHDELVFYHYNINGCVNLIYDDMCFQYIHQLQNLYFSLTGKELKLIK